MTLRSRLLAGMAFVAVVLAAVSVFITVTTSTQLIDQVDDRLAAFSPVGRVNFDPDVFGSGPGGLSGQEPAPPPGDFRERVSDVYQGFVEADGTLTDRFVPNVGDRDYSAPDLSQAELPDAGSSSFTVESTGGEVTYRVLAERIGDVVAITALPIDDVESTIDSLILVEVLGTLLILAALGLVSWWVVHLGIRPVKQMTHAATQIADGDLTVRVPESAPGTESAELADALNRMLGRIEAAMDEQAGSEERLRRFVADASHELRTPVTTIRGYAELYRHGGLADGSALDDAMRRTEQEALRMGRLVEDMLTLAKLDEQRPLSSAPVDLAELARDAGRDAQASWPDRSVTVAADDREGPFVVTGDEDRLRQVIANVVGNAFVHTTSDAAVTIAVARVGTAITFEVRDTGEGMPADVAARVTERFFRADPARARHRGGSGLGLSIVDATVHAHGGSLTVDSEPGRGTTVRITLPASA